MRWLNRIVDRRRVAGTRHSALFDSWRGGEACVSIDLETTGLDVGRDAVLSIAAVPVEGHVVRLSQALSLKVRGATDFRIEAMRHHRLRPSDIAGGVSLPDAVEALLDMIGNRPLLGYAVAFDLAVLDRIIGELHGFRLPNRVIELREVYTATCRLRHPERGDPDLRYEAVMRAVGVPVLGRHTALGDAVTTAMAYVALSRGRAGE
jgi:DNA polymerase-3 subunit epsilon